MRTRYAVAITAAVCTTATAGAAGLITGKQIKNGTIEARDLSEKARAQLRGAKGPVGAVGPAGPQGDPGPATAPGWARIEGEPTAVPGGSSGDAQAACPAGSKVTGGGWIGTTNQTITRMDAVNGTTWRVYFHSDAGGGQQSVISAVAFCLTAS